MTSLINKMSRKSDLIDKKNSVLKPMKHIKDRNPKISFSSNLYFFVANARE